MRNLKCLAAALILLGTHSSHGFLPDELLHKSLNPRVEDLSDDALKRILRKYGCQKPDETKSRMHHCDLLKAFEAGDAPSLTEVSFQRWIGVTAKAQDKAARDRDLVWGLEFQPPVEKDGSHSVYVWEVKAENQREIDALKRTSQSLLRGEIVKSEPPVVFVADQKLTTRRNSNVSLATKSVAVLGRALTLFRFDSKKNRLIALQWLDGSASADKPGPRILVFYPISKNQRGLLNQKKVITSRACRVMSEALEDQMVEDYGLLSADVQKLLSPTQAKNSDQWECSTIAREWKPGEILVLSIANGFDGSESGAGSAVGVVNLRLGIITLKSPHVVRARGDLTIRPKVGGSFREIGIDQIRISPESRTVWLLRSEDHDLGENLYGELFEVRDHQIHHILSTLLRSTRYESEAEVEAAVRNRKALEGLETPAILSSTPQRTQGRYGLVKRCSTGETSYVYAGSKYVTSQPDCVKDRWK